MKTLGIRRGVHGWPLSRRDVLRSTAAALGLGGLWGLGGMHFWASEGRAGESSTFISAKTTEATGLDPQLVAAMSRSQRTPFFYNQLVRLDYDLKPQPELAKGWETPDPTTWIFHLREGVAFHDGQEFTAADVKFTFDRLLEKSPGKSDFIAVDQVVPEGKYKVKITTKAPFGALLAALGGFWGYIVSEAGEKASGGDFMKRALGTGPFIFEDWKVEQELVARRNPNYFKQGLPKVEKLILRVIPKEDSILAALRTGQIHHAFLEDNKNFLLLKDEPNLLAYHSPRLGYDFLNMDCRRKPFDDVRVRQAINYAIDRNQIIKIAAAGFGTLTAPCTAPMKDWQLPTEVWMKYYKPDLDRARGLLRDAGYPNGQGADFTLDVIPTFPTMVNGAQVIQQQLRRVGINVTTRNVEYAVWIKNWQAKLFHATMNTTPGYADPDTAFFRAFHSKLGQNWNSWENPECDKLLEAGREETNFEKRKAIYDQMQLILLEQCPHLWLFSAELIDFAQKSVQGYRQHPTTVLYGFEEVSV
jgi:peptide/nickel transport system substrate-binding protein